MNLMGVYKVNNIVLAMIKGEKWVQIGETVLKYKDIPAISDIPIDKKTLAFKLIASTKHEIAVGWTQY